MLDILLSRTLSPDRRHTPLVVAEAHTLAPLLVLGVGEGVGEFGQSEKGLSFS